MTNRPLVLLLSLFAAASLFAAEPWDAPPFSADPKALVSAAAAVPAAAGADVLMLLDEARYSIQADGSCRYELHYVYFVGTERGVQGATTAAAAWAPWYEEKPGIQARVVAKDGSVRTLEPQAVVEASAPEQPDIFSDERIARAPLPGVVAGSVVEMLVTHQTKNVFPGSGINAEFVFGGTVPVEHARLVIDAPASFEPHVVNKSSIEPRVVEADGRKQWIFENGRTEAITHREQCLPSDELAQPYVAFSSGSSWRELARHYSEVVDKQIAAGDVRDVVAAATAGAKDRNEIVARLLAYVERNVHYAGVEVGEGSIVPRAPKGVLSNKYGDCKDKATLLVALLRAAGLPAHVALLNAAFAFDTLAELPGLSRFNHAIVVVGGANPIWVDPTDEFAKAGELPIPDQGRLALIAAPDTTSLTRTPEAPSTANRNTETRTVYLPQEGKARVIEVTQCSGFHDASMRRTRAERDAKKYEEWLREYAKGYYAATSVEKAETTDPRDLTRPYAITLEVSNSRTGIISGGQGSVAINISDLLSAAPPELRDYKEPSAGEPERAPEKKRVHDFVFPVPMVKEWTYHIVPPAGFRARTLPHNETKHYGTTTLTQELATQTDGVVVATFRYDTGKRRITAAEFEQTRVEISRALRSDDVFVGFESIGQSKLSAGDIGGALTEFRHLVTLYPKEAQHHSDIARALLAGGLGEAARDEARRAVTIEPSSAHAHATLAWVLDHDLLGREYHQGFDLPGAIAEMKKAKELDPNDSEIRGQLAELLTYGDDGYRFGHNARLSEAIDEYLSILADLGKDGKFAEPPLMLALAHAGRWDEVKRHIDTVEDPEQRKLFRILSAAAADGVPAALHELEAFDAEHRREYAKDVARTLLTMRRYTEAAAMFTAATEGTSGASDMRPIIEALKKAKPSDYSADQTPRGLMLRMMTAVLNANVDEIKALLPKDSTPHLKLENFEFNAGVVGLKDMPVTVAIDIIGGSLELQTDGNDANGYRIRGRLPSAGGADVMVLFLQRDGGKYSIVASADAPETITIAVLKLADAGKLDAARTWLNWIREGTTIRGGDDPLSGPAFARLWSKDKATATADEIRVAAATIHPDVPGAEAILLANRDKVPEESKKWIDLALLGGYLDDKDFAKALPIGERMAKAFPDSESAFGAYSAGLLYGGHAAEAEAQTKKRLERSPRDAMGMRVLMEVAAQKHDYTAAAAVTERVINELTPTVGDYNDAAWIALFTEKNLEKALDYARRASGPESPAASASLHTLAALYAVTGKNVDAREALLKSMDLRYHDMPEAHDWYVLGRMAENYGVRDAAVAAYKRVEEDKPDTGLSTWQLAQARLRAMK